MDSIADESVQVDSVQIGQTHPLLQRAGQLRMAEIVVVKEEVIFSPSEMPKYIYIPGIHTPSTRYRLIALLSSGAGKRFFFPRTENEKITPFGLALYFHHTPRPNDFPDNSSHRMRARQREDGADVSRRGSGGER